MGRSFQSKLAQKLHCSKFSKTLDRIVRSLIEVEKLLHIR